ncbi:hypothetical protein ABZY05_50685 [Streptomyces canus]|uniref:hypothetical protein n=1 Tax=Streptomyces canus TaxID=58343 RepID=UPI0033B7E57A
MRFQGQGLGKRAVRSGRRAAAVIWDARDLARDTVRRQGAGLSAVEVAAKIEEAAARRRETREQSDGAPVDRGPYASDPRELAELWEAKHAE